jgi:hypothetical protein
LRPLEDGVVIALTDVTWSHVRAALEERTPLSLPNLGLEIVRAEDPIIYFPSNPAPARPGQVQPDGIILDTPDIRDRLKVEDLATFDKELHALVEAQFAATPFAEPIGLVIDVELAQGKTALRASYRPQSPEPFASGLDRRLASLRGPTTNGPVRFRQRYQINRGVPSGAGPP